jgi:23S rRNA (uracil1939-C5)-methyltransferase
VRVSDLLKLELGDLALGGKALGRHEGRVVFVDRGLPGDHVTARVTRVKPAYAEARLESIETPSPARVEARCPHVGVCGGCRLQELPYDAQLAAKERQVRDAIQRIGGLAGVAIEPIRPAPSAFGYRNKMEFSFHPEAPDGIARLGLHERGTFDRVFELETCVLPSELTVEIVRRTQRWAAEHRWIGYHPARHTGVVRYLVVRHLRHTSECAVHLIAASDSIPGLDGWVAAVRDVSPEVRTVTLGLQRSRANVAIAEEERVLHGDGLVRERLLGLEFEATSAAFLQTNSDQAEALYTAAVDAAELQPNETALDLYCGTGTLTLLLARHAREAVGVESVPSAVLQARGNAKRNGVENVRFVAGESRAVLRAWARRERPDAPNPAVVVVDPPRAGLHPRVVTRVAELRPRRVVYVSCNPATLARDAKDFATQGLALARVEPYDMFPHTPHIECVARFERTALPRV